MVLMYGYMYICKNGKMDGWMDGWIDVYVVGCMYRWMYGL